VPSPVTTPAVATAKAPALAPTPPAPPEEPAPPPARSTPAAPVSATTNGSAVTANGSTAAEEFSDRMARLTPPPMTPYPPPRAPVIQVTAGAGSPAPSPASATIVSTAATAVSPPETQDPAASPAASGDKNDKNKGAAFRETLWFKKGDVEHMIAEARAKMAAQGAKAESDPETELTGEEAKPIEDRYVDDGSVTADDRKKFSLRTGGTATALPTVRPAALPGESMSERDVIREVSGSRRAIVVAVVGVVVAAIVAAVLWMMRDRPSLPPAPAPTARAVPAPPPPGAPPPAAGITAGRTAAKPRPTETAAAREPRSESKPSSIAKRPESADKRSSRRRSADRRSRR
jgi:hypothetical protein